MKFSKLHGSGNDFILTTELLSFGETNGITVPDLVRGLCHRRWGIGADGVMFPESSDRADIKMHYYNSDGSLGELCGNGVRCFGKYLFDNGIVSRDRMRIDTLAGIVDLTLSPGSELEQYRVSVDLPAPELNPDRIPVHSSTSDSGMPALRVDTTGGQLDLYALRVGVPHGVIFVDSLDFDINTIGRRIETDSRFPEGINVNFVKIEGEDKVSIATWERGAGRTMACGTGSCAAVFAGFTAGKLGRRVALRSSGGLLTVIIDEHGGLKLTGEIVTVFSGSYLKI